MSPFCDMSNFDQILAGFFAIRRLKIIRKTEEENEMGPNTLFIMMGAGGLIAAVLVV